MTRFANFLFAKHIKYSLQRNMLTNKSFKYKMKNEILFIHADMKLNIASIEKKK